METNKIRHFCVIAETRNFRKAATILGITHSALSKSMKVLEEELQRELFVKEGRGIELSDEGIGFYQKSQKFLKALDQLLSEKEETQKSIKIATFEVFSTHFFCEYVEAEFLGSSFVLREAVPGELEKLVLAGEVDMGLTYEVIPQQGLDILKVGRCEMGLFGKKKWEKLSLNEIPFVAPVLPFQSSISGVKGLDGWPDDRIKRNIIYSVDLFETALQLVARGKAVGYFPRFVVEIFNRSHSAELRIEALHVNDRKLPKAHRNIYIVKRTSTAEGVAIKKLARILRKIN